MNDRYEGRPLVRLLEFYFLWCIGELSPQDQDALEARTPRLAELFGHQGTWYEILETAIQLPADIRSRIVNAWQDHVNDTSSGTHRRTPAEAAEEFVDENFDIERAMD